LVAIDGRSGTGKSTIAAALAVALQASVVPSDDFFAAHITDAEWDARDAATRARDAIDWRRLRREAVEPLLAGHSPHGIRSTSPRARGPTARTPSPHTSLSASPRA